LIRSWLATLGAVTVVFAVACGPSAPAAAPTAAPAAGATSAPAKPTSIPVVAPAVSPSTSPAASPAASPIASPSPAAAALASPSPAVPVPNASVSGNVQILVGFGTGNAPNQVAVQQELADAYVKAHPNVRIDFVRVPNSTEGGRKLTTAIAGGQPPDVVLPAGRYGVFLFADQDVWVNVGQRFQQAGGTLAAYPKPVQDSAQAIGYYGGGGNLLGVPAGYHTHVLAYNKQLFAKAGVSEPPKQWNTADWTYDKLRDVAMRLTIDKNGKNATEAGFDPDNIEQWGLGHFFPETIWLAYGGKAYDPSTRKAAFDVPGGIQGLQLAADLANKDHALLTDVLAKTVGGEGGQQFLWQSGKIAMVDMCSCDLSGYGDVTGFTWDVGAMPKGPQGPFNFLNVDVGMLVKQGKNQDTAWDVLKTMTLDEPNARRLQVDSYGAIPARTEDVPYFKETFARKYPSVDVQPWLDAVQYAGGDNEDWAPAFSQVNSLKGKTFDTVMLGQGSAVEEMPKLQADAQKAIDDWFAKNKLPGQ